MRFQLIDQAKKDFPVHRLCHVLGVSQSGYFAWRIVRPAGGNAMMVMLRMFARHSRCRTARMAVRA